MLFSFVCCRDREVGCFLCFLNEESDCLEFPHSSEFGNPHQKSI